jgi:hypothetical protein
MPGPVARFACALLPLALLAACASPPRRLPSDPGKTVQVDYADPPPEVERVLRGIRERISSYHDDNEELPRGKTGLTPRAACCASPDRYCPAAVEQWSDGPWSDMGFSWEEPTQFQYGYEQKGLEFTVTAVGDPDCNGQVRRYVLTGKGSRRGGLSFDDLAMLQVE